MAKLLRNERPDYHYLKAVFKHLRVELNVPVVTKAKSLPDIPTEDEMKQYYEIVWTGKNTQDLLIVKTLLYTVARVSELVNIKLTDVDLKRFYVGVFCQEFPEDLTVFWEFLHFFCPLSRRKAYTFRCRTGVGSRFGGSELGLRPNDVIATKGLHKASMRRHTGVRHR